MGCTSSKPAAPNKKLDRDAKGAKINEKMSKVRMQPESRHCCLTVQGMCIPDRLAGFPGVKLRCTSIIVPGRVCLHSTL